MDDIKEKYENLRRATIALGIILLLVILIFLVAFFKGWFGEPGKIYFSPEDEQAYVRCADNPDICVDGTCRPVTLIIGEIEFKDSICVR